MNKPITREHFLKNTNDEELFAVIESFLIRAREKGLFDIIRQVEGKLIITDKEKFEVLRDMLKTFNSKYI